MDRRSETEPAGGSSKARFTMSRWRLVAAAAIVAAFAFQGSRGLWDPDEGRYTLTAMEMLRQGDFLVPHLHHELPHLSKPPLTYWLIAASIRLAGWNEWAVRLPDALAFAVAILLLYRLGRRLVPAAAWLPAAIYGTSLLPFLAANVVTTDTLLTLWETLAVTAFVESWWCREPRRRRALADLMWLSWGLALLTKGPPGLLPLAAVLAFAVMVEGRAGLRRLLPLEGIALFLVVGLSWYAVLIARQPELLSYFLGYELAGRLFSGVHHRNPEWYGPFKVYLPALLLGSLPWTPLLLRASGQQPAGRRAKWWTPDFWRRLTQHDHPTLLLLLWLLVPLGVFCVARSRLPFYVLPLLAPIALLLARRLEPRSPQAHRRWFRFAWAWLVALMMLKAGLAQVAWKNDARVLASALREQVPDTVDEVVFAETWPRLGLGFYLGSEVEVVTFYDADPHPMARSATGTLAEELAGEPGEKRLFVVERPDDAAFERVLKDLGYSFRRRGGWHDLEFYTVPTEKAS